MTSKLSELMTTRLCPAHCIKDRPNLSTFPCVCCLWNSNESKHTRSAAQPTLSTGSCRSETGRRSSSPRYYAPRIACMWLTCRLSSMYASLCMSTTLGNDTRTSVTRTLSASKSCPRWDDVGPARNHPCRADVRGMPRGEATLCLVPNNG